MSCCLFSHLSFRALCTAGFDQGVNIGTQARSLETARYPARPVDWWGLVPDWDVQSRCLDREHDRTNPSWLAVRCLSLPNHHFLL